MKKRRIILAAVLSVVALAGVLTCRHYDRQTAIDAVLTWGRLAEFPAEMRNFKIKTEGSMFTRGFRASFTATPDVVADWLSRSPGIADAEKWTISPTSTRYVISPGGGAQHAEVEVDRRKNRVRHRVRIYVFWS